MKLNVAGKSNMIITTEHPMTNTIDRFWQLIFEKNCKTVVLVLKKGDQDLFVSHF